MIGLPLNDGQCLGTITEMIAGMVAERDPVIAELAAKHPTTESLAEWIRTLPQRDDSAGHFNARGKRQRQRDERFHGAGQDLPVNRVDPGGGVIDQHFTDTGDRVCNLFQA